MSWDSYLLAVNIFAACSTSIFLVVYGAAHRWEAHTEGRLIMALALAVFALEIAYILLRLDALIDGRNADWRASVYPLIAFGWFGMGLVTLWATALVLRAGRTPLDEEDDADELDADELDAEGADG